MVDFLAVFAHLDTGQRIRSFVHMSKLRPVPKICQVKPQRLDYLANKVPVDLRDWVAVTESPHWFAWPNGPTTKKRAVQPSSKNASIKREEGRFFC